MSGGSEAPVFSASCRYPGPLASVSSAWREDHPYGEAAALGYPRLLQAGQGLREAGIHFTDLHRMFTSERRSVYVRVKRNDLDPFHATFDAPEPHTTRGRREATNVPAQSLAMLNDPFVIARAAAWAHSLLEDTTLNSDRQRARYPVERLAKRSSMPSWTPSSSPSGGGRSR